MDDIALLASRHSDIQEKTSRPHDIAKAVRLNINPGKTKTMRLNYKKNDPITVGGNDLEVIETFTYLDAVLDKQDGTEVDIKQGVALARSAFATLRSLWRSLSTALRLSCAFSTLM